MFRALVAYHRREPYVSANSLLVVFIADVKMRRFLEGPRRLLFGNLETEIKTQKEVYPTLADVEKLQAVLWLGLSYLFNTDFFRAVVGLDHAIPRPAE